MDNAARPWQGWVLAAMLVTALTIALVRLYRHKRLQKQLAERRRFLEEDDER